MAVRKKKTSTKKAPVRRASPRRAAAKIDAKPAWEEKVAQLESRIAALEARPQTTDFGADLHRVFGPTLESLQSSLQARRDVGTQQPFVLGGLIVVVLIIAGVLANSGAVSGDAFAVILTICLLVAGHQAWKHFRTP
ncbi:MAG: hypothetical protein AAGD14_04885 [Planctomycetota bacterium]